MKPKNEVVSIAYMLAPDLSGHEPRKDSMDVFKFKEPGSWADRARSIESSTLHQIMSKLVNSDLSAADRGKVAEELADRVWYLYHASATFHAAIRRKLPVSAEAVEGPAKPNAPPQRMRRRIVVR
jgi:hypothetical protein